MASKAERLQQKILIVEDDALVRMAGVDLLEEAGFEVVDAKSADEAVAVLEGTQAVQLLFTDIDMPGSMNGLELAELVHRRWPNVRLLITSGHHDIPEGDVPDHGRFVPKPYSSLTVVHEITDLLDDV
jgi:two-component system, response regulator PdtaR